jgi:hypothetical protein
MNVELKLADEVMSKVSMKLADVKPNTKPDKAGSGVTSPVVPLPGVLVQHWMNMPVVPLVKPW